MPKKRFYAPNKESYKEKLIPYKDSPNGKAYIGIAKRPLMPVKKGFGFMGVLMQDENREFVQCHHCGTWMKKITNFHTMKCFGKTTSEYKKKYGLFQERGLVSDETSLRLTKAALKNANILANFKGKRNNGSKHGSKGHQTAQYQNMFGTCPLQLKERLYEFIRINRELPSISNRGVNIYRVLKRRFGSWGNALEEHGLPRLERNGTNMKYTFKDGSVYEYNINRFYDREKLYHMMMRKCSVLKP